VLAGTVLAGTGLAETVLAGTVLAETGPASRRYGGRVATLTPHFREFLPDWIGRQPWYAGQGTPAMRPVGFFRLEDPDGAVGIETHLLTDGSATYQIPMTYRGAPLDHLAGDTGTEPAAALIAKAEHSELGTRWIYDAVRDPAWVAAMGTLVAARASAVTRGDPALGPVEVHGVLCRPWPVGTEPVIELRRMIAAGPPPEGPDVLGFVVRHWHDGSAGGPAVRGCLAVLRNGS
jgi:hypothetical protein